jgi:enoyl-CoA hydratase/carnithine racemase
MHDAANASAPLRAERSESVLRVTFERANRANALDAATVERFLAVLDDRELAGGLRALIVEGSGQNFCAGFDLSELESAEEAELIVRFLKIETLLQRLYHAPFVTIACAQGNALGAGADVFAACTYRLAAPDARFRMPGWQFGIALGTRRLFDRVGAEAGRDMLSANRTLDASAAAALGLATHVAARDEWPRVVAGILDDGTNDHREADMAALVASALWPAGIKQRMLAYRQSVRRPRPAT